MPPWERWNTHFDEHIPIYQQIMTLFCRSFAKGEILPGERIPSIRDMSLVLKVNANTMARVYQEMEREDLVSSKRGTGYFFTEDKSMIDKINNQMASESTKRFLEEMRALGYSDGQIVEVLSKTIEEVKGNDTVN